MTRAAVVSALMVGLGGVAAAQQTPAQREPPVYRSATELVPLNVTVTDTNSQFVRGLTADDFAVFEDGVRQEVQFFEAVEIPKDLIVLLDTSSSMLDKMDVVHEAAIGFLRTLREGDRGAVVTFADGVDIVQTLTGDGDALEAAVRRTTARGATALYNALYISIREFGQRMRLNGAIRRQAIAVLTDGDDTSSLMNFDDVLAVARKSGVSIYPIALQARQTGSRHSSSAQRRSYSNGDYSLRQIAQETGAQAFFPRHIDELNAIYSTIGQELSSQYALAYASGNAQADGRYRRITVRIAERPELRLRTRTGYTVDEGRTSTTSMLYRPR